MWKHVQRFGIVFGAIGAPLGGAAMWFAGNSIPKFIKDADGNFGTNLKWLGWQNPPQGMASAAADHSIYLGGTLLLGLSLVSLLGALIWHRIVPNRDTARSYAPEESDMHATEPPEANPTIIDESVTSNNQSGGITARIVNQAPPPDFKQIRTEEGFQPDGTYKRHIWFQVVSPYAPNALNFLVEAQGIVSCEIGPWNFAEAEELKANEYFIRIFQPRGTYDMVLVTHAKTPVKMTYSFS